MTDADLDRDHQLYHSSFQMDHLITARAGGTPFGCYKQALREWHKRDRGLFDLECERELLQIDIDDLNCTLNTKGIDGFDPRRLAVKLRQKRFALENLDKNIEETRRERDYFRQQCERFAIPDLAERRDELDAEMWEFRTLGSIALDFVSQGRLQRVTAEMIQALPPQMRDRIIVALRPENHERLIAWFLAYSPDRHEMPTLEDVTHNRLCNSTGRIRG